MLKYLLIACCIALHAVWAKPAPVQPHLVFVTPQSQVHFERFLPGASVIHHLSPLTHIYTPQEETIIYVPSSAIGGSSSSAASSSVSSPSAAVPVVPFEVISSRSLGSDDGQQAKQAEIISGPLQGFGSTVVNSFNTAAATAAQSFAGAASLAAQGASSFAGAAASFGGGNSDAASFNPATAFTDGISSAAYDLAAAAAGAGSQFAASFSGKPASSYDIVQNVVSQGQSNAQGVINTGNEAAATGQQNAGNDQGQQAISSGCQSGAQGINAGQGIGQGIGNAGSSAGQQGTGIGTGIGSGVGQQGGGAGGIGSSGAQQGISSGTVAGQQGSGTATNVGNTVIQQVGSAGNSTATQVSSNIGQGGASGGTGRSSHANYQQVEYEVPVTPILANEPRHHYVIEPAVPHIVEYVQAPTVYLAPSIAAIKTGRSLESAVAAAPQGAEQSSPLDKIIEKELQKQENQEKFNADIQKIFGQETEARFLEAKEDLQKKDNEISQEKSKKEQTAEQILKQADKEQQQSANFEKKAINSVKANVAEEQPSFEQEEAQPQSKVA